MKKNIIFSLIIKFCCFFLGFTTWNVDVELRRVILDNNLHTTNNIPELNPKKVELGRLLFFDKLLSGNKDISCATCHHPSLASIDAISLSVGVGGKGLGKNRKMGQNRELIPRNSPDLFNRGAKEWHTMFWDNRVSGSVATGFETPADEKLPEGLDNILAVQAMFPVTSRDEMRGDSGDKDVNGEINELALISNASHDVIWHRIMLRILAVPEYRTLFQEVYPNIPLKDLGFQHAANAIAAFEIAAFTFNDSPWNFYLMGDSTAISPTAKRGALLFYGDANCSSCHSGSLFTDQQAHNIGVPQFGPGKGNSRPLDLGRFLESGLEEDLFSFRTPSLRNTAITGPWMHNGAYHNLEEAIRHHLNPEQSLKQYDCNQLEDQVKATCQNSEKVAQRLLDNIDPKLTIDISLSNENIKELAAFLETLTDYSALHLDDLIPDAVPSGLPVAD